VGYTVDCLGCDVGSPPAVRIRWTEQLVIILYPLSPWAYRSRSCSAGESPKGNCAGPTAGLSDLRTMRPR